MGPCQESTQITNELFAASIASVVAAAVSIACSTMVGWPAVCPFLHCGNQFGTVALNPIVTSATAFLVVSAKLILAHFAGAAIATLLLVAS